MHGDFIYMHMFWPFIALAAVGCDCDPADAETSSPDKTSVRYLSLHSQCTVVQCEKRGEASAGRIRTERRLKAQNLLILRFNIGTPCERLRKPTKESELNVRTEIDEKAE